MKSECRFKRKNVGRLREDRKKEAHVMVGEKGEIAFIASANNIMSTTTQEEIEFIADSGATDHPINDENYFNGGAVDLEKPIRINLAKGGESLIATKVKTITTTTCKLESVLSVPGYTVEEDVRSHHLHSLPMQENRISSTSTSTSEDMDEIEEEVPPQFNLVNRWEQWIGSSNPNGG
ncbi:hypothetical protein JTB14_002591 [Gonioctena quinquepunctata]|nr:hypothetical protein JTB14_002591 [Gonioctena quinquepunctata]